jgi:hypothetical protein
MRWPWREGRLGLGIGEAEIKHLKAFQWFQRSVLRASSHPAPSVRPTRRRKSASAFQVREIQVESRRSFCKSGSMPSACATVADRLQPPSSVGRFQRSRQSALSGHRSDRSSPRSCLKGIGEPGQQFEGSGDALFGVAISVRSLSCSMVVVP